MSDRDPYKVLQVDREAIPEVVTAAYRALARRLHPERDLTGVAEVRMAEINRAYALLRDPAQRKAYDARAAAAASKEQVAVGPGPNSPTPGTPGRFEARRSHDDAADAKLDFGRYSGWSLRDLAREDPDYLRWLSRHSSGIRFRRAIQALLTDGNGIAGPARQ